jgi:hypothetical protein
MVVLVSVLDGSTHCELFNFNIYDFGVISIQVPTDRPSIPVSTDHVFQFQPTKLRPVHLALHLSCATCSPLEEWTGGNSTW